MKQVRPYPAVIVSKKAVHKLQTGHPWVFEGEVQKVVAAPIDGQEAVNGDVVDVLEENGTYQGTGLLSLGSKIRVRIVTRNANDRIDEAFWQRKIEWAWRMRSHVLGARSLEGHAPDTETCRVIFSEADGFPGLIVDRYGKVLVAQVGTVGMDRLRPVIYPLLVKVLREAGQDIQGLYERNDAPSRAKEGLPLEKGWFDLGDCAETPATCFEVEEGGIRYALDIENSQKTGYFLDQKYNRRAVRQLAAGKRVLDVFSNVGSFGLNAAAGGAKSVRLVDISQEALDSAKTNAELNGFTDKMAYTCGDALEYLDRLARDKEALRKEGGPFDLIVLDPPAFTKSRGATEAAKKAYERINRSALRMLPRGGYLATCSCSHFMSTSMLMSAISEAAQQAGVQIRQLEQRQQAPDHPILWGVPETHYLDFFIFQVV